ncbi:hypothetical protein [Curvibacter gracilis]|uniref:hypothetical protein n=1 Tax=Curvibacter gracilis TaxID=230310 RepID=UPI0004834070|nr:hypothetical protein [Curvibacter gracilis]
MTVGDCSLKALVATQADLAWVSPCSTMLPLRPTLLAQALRQDAGHLVCRTPSLTWDHPMNWLFRVVLQRLRKCAGLKSQQKKNQCQAMHFIE